MIDRWILENGLDRLGRRNSLNDALTTCLNAWTSMLEPVLRHRNIFFLNAAKKKGRDVLLTSNFMSSGQENDIVCLRAGA